MTRVASWRSRSARVSRSTSCLRLVLEVGADLRPQRVERLERPEVLGQLVVERRDHPGADGLDRDVVGHGGAGELLDGVVRGIAHVEGLRAAGAEADERLVESGRIGRGADVDRDVVMAVGVGLAVGGRLAIVGPGSCRALEIEHDRIAVRHPAPFDRLVAGGAILQARQRLIDRRVVHLRDLAAQGEARVVTRVDGRHRFEAGRELERLALFDDDVADVGRVDRLDATFAQRLVDGARDEAVCHIVQDLIAEALPHDLRWHLARPEPRDPRRSAVIAGDLVDLGVDHRARDFDHQVLAGVADVDEFGFHVGFGLKCGNRGHLPSLACSPGRPEAYAKGGSRTPKAFRLPDPKSGASASSATFALDFDCSPSRKSRGPHEVVRAFGCGCGRTGQTTPVAYPIKTRPQKLYRRELNWRRTHICHDLRR